MKGLVVRLILEYLRFFAQLAIFINKPTIIGITGSAGKTSTRDAIYAVLKDKYRIYAIKKSNSETGVPLGVLGLKVHSLGFDSLHKSIKDWGKLLIQVPSRIFFLRKYQYLLVEMGVDDPYPPKNMEYLLSIVQPEIAVVLNAYPIHSKQFEKAVEKPITIEKLTIAIAQEKVKMVTHNPRCRVAIYNKDNESITQFLDEIDIDTIIFGSSDENHISYMDYDLSSEKTVFSYRVGSKRPLTIEIKSYVLPKVYREVIAAAILVGRYLGMELPAIKTALEKNFTIEPGRSTIFDGQKDTTIIDSSYNASRESVIAHLELAESLKRQTGKPLVFVFGDMRELGKSTKSEHELVAEMLPGSVDYLYTVGPLTKKYVYNKLKNKKVFREIRAFSGPHQVGDYLKKSVPEGSLVLFKGSQNTIFLEEAVKHILKNAHDAALLPRQEDYWMRKKQFSLE